MKRVVVIGASAAGHNFAVELRSKCPDCSIALVTEETAGFYDRRRLFDYLARKIREKDLIASNEDFYREKDIAFLKERKAAAVNTQKHIVTVRNQDQRENIEYDYLIICSGRRFIIPDIPGSKKPGVFALNSYQAVKDLSACIDSDTLTIAGSNEWAFQLARMLTVPGRDVKLVSSYSDSNAGGVNPVGDAVNIRHEQKEGADSTALTATESSGSLEIIGSTITEIIGESGVAAVKLGNGKIIGTSAVVFMDEVKANSEFLAYTGIDIKGDLVLCDPDFKTNIPHIFACGSVCCQEGHYLMKSWDDSAREGKILAERISALIKG